MISPGSKIFIAGHRGMVGSAVNRLAVAKGFSEILTADRSELDLTNQASVNQYLGDHKPDAVVFAAARVGGIHANSTYPAEFIYQNLSMAVNTIHAAWQSGCERFLFLGSTCIYPREAPQPMPESCLLSGPLEVTNEAYAVAKIAGLKMCEHYRSQYGVCFHSAMPTNLYGPGDNYHPENSHVIPALLRRFHDAKISSAPSVTMWGTGRARREFLHVNDMAKAVVHLLQIDQPPDLANVGTGSDVSIAELGKLIADVVGFEGTIEFDTTKPDGTLLKRTDTRIISDCGWQPTVALRDGLIATYEVFKNELESDTVRAK